MERRVAGDQRAGSWPRAEFSRRQWEYLKADWLLALLPLGFAVILSPGVFLLPAWVRGFALGVMLTSGVWAVAMALVLMSGAGPQYLGQMAEQFVARAFREARQHGWRLANHMSVSTGNADIGHLVVGPAGVFVVETKYSSDGWSNAFARQRLESAVAGARHNANKVVAFLQPFVPRDRARAVVVIMGKTSRTDPIRAVDGVTVVPGARLREWVADQQDGALGPEAVAGAWSKVLARVNQRDRQDRARTGPPVLGVWDFVSRAVLVFCAGALVEIEVLRLVSYRWFLALGALSALVSLFARRHQVRGAWIWAWTAGTQFVTVTFAIAYGTAVVLRIAG